jgi:UDP-galactopyranose mutase
MIQNMLEGVEIHLNVYPDYWKQIAAKKIVYCGRLDRVIYGSRKLPYRSLDITFNNELWDSTATTVNFCHKRNLCTRKTNYGLFHGNADFQFIAYETPRDANLDEVCPYYPIPSDQNRQSYYLLEKEVLQKYPNLIPLGRLGMYKYLNMDQAVGEGMKVARQIDAEKTH